MAKDEVSKQLEELERYLKEQEIKERQRAGRDSQESSLEDEYKDGLFYDSGADMQEISANGPVKQKKGCGCASFLFFVFCLGMFASIVGKYIDKKPASDEPRTAVATSRAIPAERTREAVSPAAAEEEQMSLEVSSSNEEKQLSAEEKRRQAALLKRQQIQIGKALETFVKAEPQYKEMMPQSYKEKNYVHTTARSKERFFAEMLENAKNGRAEYSGTEMVAIDYYLNYSRLELEKENIEAELKKLSGRK